MELIDKAAVVAEIKRRKEESWLGSYTKEKGIIFDITNEILSFLDTLEVKDPYEQCVQYDSIKAGIQAHAEDYSFNIESELFNQLTKEQQALWKKEIEQACISGGYDGVELARDPRYKENFEVKEVDLEKYYHKFLQKEWFGNSHVRTISEMMAFTAKHFFELGLKAQKGE